MPMLNFGPQGLGPHGPPFETNLKHNILLMFQTNHDCLTTTGSSEENFKAFSPLKPILNFGPQVLGPHGPVEPSFEQT